MNVENYVSVHDPTDLIQGTISSTVHGNVTERPELFFLLI